MLRLTSWIVVAGLIAGVECRAQDSSSFFGRELTERRVVAKQVQELGQPISIDLKEATLGQVVDALTSSGSPTEKEGVKPINVLISDQLREIPVGTIKLNNVYPRAALEGICKLTDGVFLIEEVADGQVLVLKELKKPIVVRAIKLQRPSLPNAGSMMSMLSGDGAEKSEEALQDEAKALEIRFEMQIQQTLESVEVAFDLYEKESGTHLSRPKLQIQDQLRMVIAVGTEESVAIAAEIIETSMGGGSSNRRMGGGMGMGGMGAMGGDMMMGGSMGSGMMGGSGFGSRMSGAGSSGADPNLPAPQRR